MPKQTDLFDDFASADRTKPLARATDPQSSHAAADAAVSSGLVRGHEAKILAGCRKWPGLTANQLGDKIRLTGVQVNRRLKTMEAKGLIRRIEFDGTSGTELTIYPRG